MKKMKASVGGKRKGDPSQKNMTYKSSGSEEGVVYTMKRMKTGAVAGAAAGVVFILELLANFFFFGNPLIFNLFLKEIVVMALGGAIIWPLMFLVLQKIAGSFCKKVLLFSYIILVAKYLLSGALVYWRYSPQYLITSVLAIAGAGFVFAKVVERMSVRK